MTPSPCTLDLEDPKVSLRSCLVFAVRDWPTDDKRSAWIYGIVVGYDADAMREVAEQWDWNANEVERLRRLHRRFEALRLPEAAEVA